MECRANTALIIRDCKYFVGLLRRAKEVTTIIEFALKFSAADSEKQLTCRPVQPPHLFLYAHTRFIIPAGIYGRLQPIPKANGYSRKTNRRQRHDTH